MTNRSCPDHICENDAERHEGRVEVLEFIRDHIEVGETYRRRDADLAFAELLPSKPGWLEQEEYEERTRVGFQLERLAKATSEFAMAQFALTARSNSDEA